MVRRALLVGSATGGLTGVDNDIAAMAESLDKHGFQLNCCQGSQATRWGILSAVNRLIKDSQVGDAVLFYYSGHGCFARNPDYRPGRGQPAFYQALVPVDLADSTPTDFRGILNLELEFLLAKLTRKSGNVSAVLDCCHAAGMARECGLVPKAMPQPWTVGISDHLAHLDLPGHVVRNPELVCLAAAGRHQLAFERRGQGGRTMGLLTESFCCLLAEVEDGTLTWDALGRRVMERVLALSGCQRPSLAGPVRRFLFRLDKAPSGAWISLYHQNNGTFLRAGRLHGLCQKSIYGVVAPAATHPDPKAVIARAEVVSVEAGRSRVRLCPPGRAVPSGSRAFPMVLTLPKERVFVHECRPLFSARLAESAILEMGEPDDRPPLLAIVVRTNNRLIIRDRAGRRACHDKSADTQGQGEAVSQIETMARARRLLAIQSGTGGSKLTTPFRLHWGRLKHGQMKPLAPAGAILRNKDRVYLQVTNLGAQTIYVSAFNIGVSSRIKLLNTTFPDGVAIEPGADWILGRTLAGVVMGLPLEWPSLVPQDGPRAEYLVVIVSNQPQDLTCYQTGSWRNSWAGPKSELQCRLDLFLRGGAAKLRPLREIQTAAYAVRHISFINGG